MFFSDFVVFVAVVVFMVCVALVALGFFALWGCFGSLAFAVSWFLCFSLSEFICMCLRKGLTHVFNKCPNLPFSKF